VNVTVEVVGEGTDEYSLPDDATYADLIREAGYHPQEASVLVDGAPGAGRSPVRGRRCRPSTASPGRRGS